MKGCWFVLCAVKGGLCAWQVSQDTPRVPVMWAHDVHRDWAVETVLLPKPSVCILYPSGTFWSLFSDLSDSGGRGKSQGALGGFICEGLLCSE